MSPLGLQPIPPGLKPILPYIQRAEELKNQDPVIAYWCAYYAAQVGISLRSREAQSRDLLSALLGILENMKNAIGPNDAIDIENVSAAYVENFALKVFANADDEDRSSRTTRSTAKKFLAAANFLEVLKTFPKTDVSESNEEKIRYAKWKAAEIAKAFREGRKPTPGPPGWAEEQELKRLQLAQEHDYDILAPPTILPPSLSPENHAIPSSSPPRTSSHEVGSSPPTSFHSSHFNGSGQFSSQGQDIHSSPTRPFPAWAEKGDPASENWSTVATPGTEPVTGVFSGIASSSSAVFGWDTSPTNVEKPSKPRSGSGSSSGTVGSSGGRAILKSNPWTDDELASVQGSSSSPPRSYGNSGSPGSDKKVHFAPLTSSSPSVTPPSQPSLLQSGSLPEYQGPTSIYAPQRGSPPTIIPPPDPVAAQAWGLPHPTTASSHSYNIYAAPAPAPSGHSPPYFELTPGIIAKAQKHCRFAISSLDYEDVEQARKELKAALATLGG